MIYNEFDILILTFCFSEFYSDVVVGIFIESDCFVDCVICLLSSKFFSYVSYYLFFNNINN